MSRLYPRCSSFDCTGRYTRLDSTVEIYILGTILSVNIRIVYLDILLGSIFKVYFNLSQVFFNHPVSHFTTLQHEVTHDQSQIVLLCTWPMVLPMQRVSQIVRYFTMLQHELINDQSQSFLLRTRPSILPIEHIAYLQNALWEGYASFSRLAIWSMKKCLFSDI